MTTIHVIGLVGQQLPDKMRQVLTPPVAVLVCSAAIREVIVSHLPAAGNIRWLSITPLHHCLGELRKQQEGDGPIVVAVTGDPLFFGFGRLLTDTFADREIIFEPSLSTMQLCFARFGIPWDDAQFLSLHGRPLHLIERKLQAEKLFLFTDRTNSPAAVARFLIDRFGEQEAGRYHLSVGECLATARERLLEGTPQALAEQVFHEPNCLILRNTAPATDADKPRFGLREQELVHSRGLITKNEVRAAVLHALALPQQGVLWDIGAGSGSVGIEAARLFPELTVYSVEKNDMERANIQANRQRFRCWNLIVVPGAAPSALTRLPLPDRVFIGGSGGNLPSILKYLFNTIAGSTIIVLTAVSDRTRSQAPRLLVDGGYRVTVSRVSVSRFVGVDGEETRLNPIDIIRAERDDD